ncbi:MAG: ABC transporter ATP-binding protein [Oscillospiraceae bacterium]
MSECIRTVKLRKCFHNSEVVRSIDLKVEQGQIFAFLGPNGAGKSTTMNMLTTLLQKTDGKIYIDGLDMDKSKNIIKGKIGVVFQEDVLDKELTVAQNLKYRGGLYIKKRQDLNDKIGDVVRVLSMEEFLYKKYGECSGGQRRIAQIGRALLAQPQLLILDEPTTGLDPIARRQVWQVLFRLRKEYGMTIFFATHYMEEAAFADNICILNNGNVLLCDSLRNIRKKTASTQTPELEQLYFHLLEGAKK